MLNFSCLCNLKMKNLEITYLNIKNNSILCSLYCAAPTHATPMLLVYAQHEELNNVAQSKNVWEIKNGCATEGKNAWSMQNVTKCLI